MALQDTDNLIVQRGTTLNKVQIQNMSTIQDSDLLVVGRGSDSYKITGQEFKESVKPPAEVIKPQILAPANGAGSTVPLTLSELVTVSQEFDNAATIESVVGNLGIQGLPHASNSQLEGVTGEQFFDTLDLIINGVTTLEVCESVWETGSWNGNTNYSTAVNAFSGQSNQRAYIRQDNSITLNFPDTGTYVLYAGDAGGTNVRKALVALLTADGSVREVTSPVNPNVDKLVFQITKPGTVRVAPAASYLLYFYGSSFSSPQVRDTLALSTNNNLDKLYTSNEVYQLSGATGKVNSVSVANKKIYLRTSTGTWNPGETVYGPESLSADAAPDPSGVNFVGSTFTSSDGSLVAASADWQVAELADTGYTSPISQVTGHPEMGPPPTWTSGALEGTTEYRARTKYKAASGEESPWSDDVTFKTASGLADVRINAMKIYGWSNGSGGWITGGSVTDLETYLIGANHYNNDLNDPTKTGNNCVYSNATDGYIELILRNGPGSKCEVVWGNMNSAPTNCSVDISGDCQEAGTNVLIVDTDKNTFPKYSLILTATKEDAICRITSKQPVPPVPGAANPNAKDPQLGFYYISGLPGAPATVYHPNNFYSEISESPTSAEYVKLNYGINPETDPARAALIGIYPLTEAPEGYTATHYVKEGSTYTAIPHEFSNEERYFIDRIKTIGTSIREFVRDCIPSWDAQTTYYTGMFVDHNGSLWRAASQSTGVEPVVSDDPDYVDPDWTFIK